MLDSVEKHSEGYSKVLGRELTSSIKGDYARHASQLHYLGVLRKSWVGYPEAIGRVARQKVISPSIWEEYSEVLRRLLRSK